VNATIAIFLAAAVTMLFLGVPIAPTLALASILFFTLEGLPMVTVIQRLFAGIDIVVLLCIPFFILAGGLMAQGGIARRLVQVANLAVGNTTGGLAYITIIVSAVFAAMTGSAMACCVTIGAIMLPYMKEAGYRRDYSVSVVCAGAVLGPIIPPSTAMIIYAVNSNQSVTALYKLGIPTGIIMAAGLGIVSFVICKRRGYRGIDKARSLDLRGSQEITASIVAKTVFGAIPAFLSPVIILGSLFLGICTPTESALIAVLYSLLIGIFVYRELDIKKLPRLLADCAVSTAKVLFIISAAGLFAWIVSYARLPQLVLAGMMSVSDNRNVILLLIICILLIMGCVMEATPIMLITIPMFLPVIQELGFSPLHFGVVMTVAVCIGFVTPPFGTVLFTGSAVSGVPVHEITRQIVPYIAVMIACLLVIAYFPQLTMFIL
jgi:C4-dicarboxylate transporter DctM subunit